MSLPSGAERGLRFPFHPPPFIPFYLSFTRIQSHRSPDPVLLSPFMYVYDRLFPSRSHRPQFSTRRVSIFMHFVQSITDSGYQFNLALHGVDVFKSV